mgnify:CR=1 FL=1
MKANVLIALLSIFVITSCNKNDNESDVIIDRKVIMEEHERMNRISEKYNAERYLDTLSFYTTYEFQEYISKRSTYLINYFEIYDIEKQDSVFQVSIEINSKILESHILKLRCSQEQLNKIDPLFPNNISKALEKLNNTKMVLIVKINNAVKRKFVWEDSSGFLFTGEIVEIIQY